MFRHPKRVVFLEEDVSTYQRCIKCIVYINEFSDSKLNKIFVC